MRNVYWLSCVCAVVLLTVTGGGCIGLTNTASNSSDGNTSADGADANSSNGNGTDATDDSQTDDDATTDESTAQVEQVYCDGVIAVRDLPAAGQTGAFQISGATGSFVGWIIGDDVVFDAAFNRLTNRDRALEVTVSLLGVRVRAARIITYSTGRSVITLDDSSLWMTNAADRPEALDWQASDDVIVVQPASGSEWWLVNIDRCEAIRATAAI